jgi:hypothetical protein
VSDEYVARYEGLSHQQLWTQLKAGDPGQVDALAAAWKSLHDTADSMATTLDGDLTKLTAGWSSTSGTEYQRRLGLISQFSTSMAGEFSALNQHLTLMAGDLRTAQQHAEDPAAADNNDQMIQDAAIGFAVAGPVGGVLGGLFGHSQDQQEQEKARQRMVQLVAGLAGDYALTTQSWFDAGVPIPNDLPGDNTPGGRYTAQSGPGAGGVGTVGGLGGGAIPPPRTVTDPKSLAQGPTSGSGTGQNGDAPVGPDGKPIDPATELAGAGELAGVGLLGLGGVTASVLGATGGSGLGGAFGPGGGLAGAPGPAAGSGIGGAGGSAGEPTSVANTRLTGRQGAAGTGRGGVGEDEPDERMTWLTEDDMVWGAEQAPPSVLGERPAEEADTAE